MSDFVLFLKLGLFHVLDWNAYDHILFLTMLVVSYTFLDWRRLLMLISLFTLGHTTSLLLANFGVVTVSSKWVEFLIPITILTGSLYNIFTAGKKTATKGVNLLYFVTTFFGLIHGFGFASYYKMIHQDDSLLPLLYFALGVEVAQIVIAILWLGLAFVFKSVFNVRKRDWILVISSIAFGMTISLLAENWVF